MKKIVDNKANMLTLQGMKYVLLFLISMLSLDAATKSQEIVAATLIMEAGGEYAQGSMESVYEVISNRSKARNKSNEQVCLQKFQFSCWNGVKDVDSKIEKAKKHPRWGKAFKIASQQKAMTNYTKGAQYYFADTMKKYPSWSKGMIQTNHIGHHIFFITTTQ